MINVFDTVFHGPKAEYLTRYGVRYKLEKRFSLGKRVLYTFVASGYEKLLVVPCFAEQYYAALKKVKACRSKSSYEVFKKWVKTTFGTKIFEDTCSSAMCKSGVLHTIEVDWNGIRLTLEYADGKVSMAERFEILNDSVFGSGVAVEMNLKTDE